jgi:hypothetical protein
MARTEIMNTGVPSLWSIQAVIIDLLRTALTPRNFMLADLARAKQAAQRLADAKRKRQRQRIFSAATLS